MTSQGSTTEVHRLIKETDFEMSTRTTLAKVQDDISILLYYFARAAITKYLRLGGLSNRNLQTWNEIYFLTGFGGQKPKIDQL